MKYDEKDSPLPLEQCETTWHEPYSGLHYLGPAGPATTTVELAQFCHMAGARVRVCDECLAKMTNPKTEAGCADCNNGAFVADFVTVLS